MWRRHTPVAHIAATDAPSGPWLKVAVCEESGRNDATYGYLGILPSTWINYGGQRFSPTAGGATWQEQVTVAYSIQSTVPDQIVCSKSGW